MISDRDRALVIQRPAKAVYYPPQHLWAYADLQLLTDSYDAAAWLDTLQRAERQQNGMILAEGHHLGVDRIIAVVRFQGAQFTDLRSRASGHDCQPGNLHYRSGSPEPAGCPGLLNQVLKLLDLLVDDRLYRHNTCCWCDYCSMYAGRLR